VLRICEQNFDFACVYVYVAEFQYGRVHVISVPQDAVVTVGSDVTLNCTVAALAVGDSLAWWHQTAHSSTRLFLSHGIEPEDVSSVDTDKYEIRGHYSLVVKSVDFDDAGVYVCEIAGHGNYTAEVSVLGQFFSFFFCFDVIGRIFCRG